MHSALNELCDFLMTRATAVERVRNERGLQMEIGLHFRTKGWCVSFETACEVGTPSEQTKKQKRYVDLIVEANEERFAIELKVPRAGRVPETMYDFYADVSFVEALVRSGTADRGACVLVTDDKDFWSGRKIDGIYAPLRDDDRTLHGKYEKPTGAKDLSVVVEGEYDLQWEHLGNSVLLPKARFVLADVS